MSLLYYCWFVVCFFRNLKLNPRTKKTQRPLKICWILKSSFKICRR